MTATQSVLLLATILLAIGGVLLTKGAATLVGRLPRHRLAGIILTCLCVAWAGWTLTIHPIDFLAFLTPGKILIGCIILTPLICIYLDNLLFARALGGILMLWPMPVILLTRDYLTTWRLVPITIGYISLTAGMFFVFHPWIFRCICETLAENRKIRFITAWSFILAGLLCFIATNLFGKVLGQ
ncbi:MAG: hypothetical protein IJV69_01580 [Kiritimatiellae bacterium]|nr:hypothetical protein [Kiritimatiellia bacterium]